MKDRLVCLNTYSTVAAIVGAAFAVLTFPSTASDFDNLVAKLEQHLKQCTQEFGFDPEQPEGLGEYELASGEKEWRACAYEGITKIMIRDSLYPSMYRRLITEDKAMLEKIVRKEMTRAERKERLNILINEIRAREKEEREMVEQQMDEMRQRMVDLQREMNRMRAIESIARPAIPRR